MSLTDLIRQVSTTAVQAQSPVQVMRGQVLSADPLEVRLDQRLTLGAAFLTVCESLQPLKLEIGGSEYEVRRGLQAGEEVLLLRVQGGQQYAVLDRVVRS